MGEAVQLVLIFCTTVVAIVSIVALVVYNRDKILMKIQTQANVADKIKGDFKVEIEDNSANIKK